MKRSAFWTNIGVSVAFVLVFVALCTWATLNPEPKQVRSDFLSALSRAFIVTAPVAAVLFLVCVISPTRLEASPDKLIITCRLGRRTTIDAALIDGVVINGLGPGPKRRSVMLRLRGRRRLLSIDVDSFTESRDVIEQTLQTLYGKCDVVSSLDPGSPIWDSLNTEYAKAQEFRWRSRAAVLWEIVGYCCLAMALVGIALVSVLHQASLKWLVETDRIGEVTGTLGIVLVIAFVLANAVMTALELMRGGLAHEMIATKEQLLIRSRFKTRAIPRGSILAVVIDQVGTPVRIFIHVRTNAGREWWMRLSERFWTNRRWSMAASLLWLYGDVTKQG